MISSGIGVMKKQTNLFVVEPQIQEHLEAAKDSDIGEIVGSLK